MLVVVNYEVDDVPTVRGEGRGGGVVGEERLWLVDGVVGAERGLEGGRGEGGKFAGVGAASCEVEVCGGGGGGGGEVEIGVEVGSRVRTVWRVSAGGDGGC